MGSFITLSEVSKSSSLMVQEERRTGAGNGMERRDAEGSVEDERRKRSDG